MIVLGLGNYLGMVRWFLNFFSDGFSLLVSCFMVVGIG